MFELTFNIRIDEIADAVDKVIDLARTLPCGRGTLDNLHLAMMEALTNAVVHGNRGDAGKAVKICMDCDTPSQLSICVTDQGDGFDPSALRDPVADENLCASHGRGLFLMKHLVDDVEFRLGGRQVILRRRQPLP